MDTILQQTFLLRSELGKLFQKRKCDGLDPDGAGVEQLQHPLVGIVFAGNLRVGKDGGKFCVQLGADIGKCFQRGVDPTIFDFGEVDDGNADPLCQLFLRNVLLLSARLDALADDGVVNHDVSPPVYVSCTDNTGLN